jgi:signal peptidase II
MKRPALIIFFILFFDQALKLWVKTHMYLGQEFRIFDWFIIHYTENNGMAFGFEFGGISGKLFLSIFRIIASAVIGWYLYKLISKKAHSGLILCFSLIFAGAIGNIIDSAFYGIIFSEEVNGLSQLFSPLGGYSGFLQGRVVDMFYFPLINTQFPNWFPIIGGQPFQFFRPVFNVADSSISIGVILFIIFQKKFVEKAKVEDLTDSQTEAIKKDIVE